MNYLQLKEAGFLSEDERTYSEDYYYYEDSFADKGNSQKIKKLKGGLFGGVMNIKNKIKNWANSEKTNRALKGGLGWSLGKNTVGNSPEKTKTPKSLTPDQLQKIKDKEKIARWKQLEETKKMHAEIKQKREEYQKEKSSQQKKAERLSEIKSKKESSRNTDEGKAKVHDIKSRAWDRSKRNLMSSDEGKKHSKNRNLTTVGTTVGGVALGGGAAYLMTSKWRKELAALKLKEDKTPEDLNKIKILKRKIVGATAAGSVIGGVAGNRVGAHLGKKSTSKFIKNKIGDKPEFKK